MTTDTKVVARWYNNRAMGNMFESVDGNYVLFTDHERVVGELRAEAERLLALIDQLDAAPGVK